MANLLAQADDVLRCRGWTVSPARIGRAIAALVSLILVFGMFYGAVMGTYGGLMGGRLWQVAFAAIKVPLLLLLTFGIGYSFFFAMNTLLGLRSDFAFAVRALFAAQAALAIILASLAPFTAFWYLSTTGYEEATLFNAGMFAIASLGAQFLLRAHYRPLIQRNSRHRVMLWTWLATYAFVGIQMAWLLRPYIGDPNAPVEFFREESWGNAYIEVYQTIRAALGWGM